MHRIILCKVEAQFCLSDCIQQLLQAKIKVSAGQAEERNKCQKQHYTALMLDPFVRKSQHCKQMSQDRTCAVEVLQMKLD